MKEKIEVPAKNRNITPTMLARTRLITERIRRNLLAGEPRIYAEIHVGRWFHGGFISG